MKNSSLIQEIVNDLTKKFDTKQIEAIKKMLYKHLENKDIIEHHSNEPKTNEEALTSFISAKRIEGCSDRSLKYYENTIKFLFKKVKNIYFAINTEELRTFLSNYAEESHASKATIDNLRRVISSFFSWLESEDYIGKSPVRRIHRVRTGKKVKEVYTDEFLELLRQNTTCSRNLAIIDFLYSTGMRVGELVRINITDVDFENRECVVLGKGNKQRKVYFDAKTKIHLRQYIDSRDDDNGALFVSIFKPYRRLKISGVEIFLRKLGKKLNVKVHPHKFRRTLATKAIDKGMPIEQVQHMLGHAKIDTTLGYALVDDTNVKNSHKKYLD